MLGKAEFHFAHSIDYNIHLCLYHCGFENCVPAHSWGPVVRDHFLVHYVTNGKGTFHVQDKVYTIEKGQGFLICPGVKTTYMADLQDPWTYYWVGFNGLDASAYLSRAGLNEEQPVFSYNIDDKLLECFYKMLEVENLTSTRDLWYTSQLYAFLAILINGSKVQNMNERQSNAKEKYVRTAMEFIHRNYSRSITVEEISKFVGLNRKYLFSLFKSFLGVSLQGYLIDFRLKKACELLKNKSLSIGDIARSVGYDDQFLFSRTFSSHMGYSPTSFRKGMEE